MGLKPIHVSYFLLSILALDLMVPGHRTYALIPQIKSILTVSVDGAVQMVRGVQPPSGRADDGYREEGSESEQEPYNPNPQDNQKQECTGTLLDAYREGCNL